MKQLKQLLFSFNGRIDRKTYWLGQVLLNTISIFIGVIIFDEFMDISLNDNMLLIIPIILGILFTWIFLSLLIKRLHDINRSAWYSLIFIALLGGGQITNDELLSLIFLRLEFIGVLIVGFIKGTPISNNYGPPPKDNGELN